MPRPRRPAEHLWRLRFSRLPQPRQRPRLPPSLRHRRKKTLPTTSPSNGVRFPSRLTSIICLPVRLTGNIRSGAARQSVRIEEHRYADGRRTSQRNRQTKGYGHPEYPTAGTGILVFPTKPHRQAEEDACSAVCISRRTSLLLSRHSRCRRTDRQKKTQRIDLYQYNSRQFP